MTPLEPPDPVRKIFDGRIFSVVVESITLTCVNNGAKPGGRTPPAGRRGTSVGARAR